MNACTAPVFVTSSPLGGQTFGSYGVSNGMNVNTPAKLGPQTLYACRYDNWYVVSKQADQQGTVLAYPNVWESFQPGAPPFSAYTAITSTFAETSPHVGIYDAAYTLVFDNGLDGTPGDEIEIWVDSYDRVPPGNKMATTTLGGHTYDMYVAFSGAYLFTLVPTATFTSGTLDLLAIINWVITQGSLQAEPPLGAIEFGFEIVDTAGGNATFQVTNFSIMAQTSGGFDASPD